MSSEDQVRAALKALADHDRSQESRTPAHAVYARKPTAKRKPGAVFGAIGLAAAAAIVAFLLQPSPQAPVPSAPKTPLIDTAVRTTAPAAESAEPASAPSPMPVAEVTPKAAPREVVTDFFPLMDVPPPFERGQLLRVVVPAATMRTVGLPVNPDRLSERVQADVLVGEEGMARAIRFVSYEQ
jgi:hypothetical protein